MKTRLIGYLLGISLCLGLTGCSEPRGVSSALPTASPAAAFRPTATTLPAVARTSPPLSASPTVSSTLSASLKNVLLDFAWFPDGKRFAVYTNHGIFFYDTVGLAKTEFKKIYHSDYEPDLKAGAVAISRDAATIAISGEAAGEVVDFWDVRTGKFLGQLYKYDLDGYFVTELEYSLDGRVLFVRSTNPFSERCQTAEDLLDLHILNPTNYMYDAKGLDKSHCRYDPATFRFTNDGKFYLFRRSMGEYYAVTSVVYGISVVTEDNVYQYRDGELYDVSPDGSVFARMAPVSPDEASTELLDAKSNEPLLSNIHGRVYLLDGAKQFLVNEGKDWKLWRNGQTVCSYAGVSGSPNWKFSANGKFFADLTNEENVRIWRVDDCQMLGSLSFDE